MNLRLKAVYRHGAFVPEVPCDLPDDTPVHILVEIPSVMPPQATDAAERRRILLGVTERMKQNPIPRGAPKRWQRDELHARR